MKNSLFITASALSLMSFQASAQLFPLNVVPHLISIRKQDLETMRRLWQEKEKMRDYDNRQVNKEELTRELMKKREELFEHTKISEIKFKQTYIKKIELSENGVLSSEEGRDCKRL